MFQDTSIDCAICLEPLVVGVDDSDYKSDDEKPPPKKVITLGCGHRWHLDCIRQQLEIARPVSTNRRLLFSGCQCAKCGTICDHDELDDLTRSTDSLRDKVNRLVLEQLQQQGHSKNMNNNNNNNGDGDDSTTIINKLSKDWKEAQHDPSKREKVLQEARRKFAFYMCAHCQEPYFGGTVECFIDNDDEHGEEETRLCVACTPQTQLICRNPLEHGMSLIWKCRYCCNPATHVCYGNVHFCDTCHDRNSRRVRQRRTKSSTQPTIVLSAVPCKGKSCLYPKINGGEDIMTDESSSGVVTEYHLNGPSPDCEQVYACVHCQSTSFNTEEREKGPGSPNLLKNPSGEQGLRWWRQLNSFMSWEVEQSQLPVNASSTTNFVSSFQQCIMCQTVDLSRVIRNLQVPEGGFDVSNFRIQVSARFMGRTDCPSVFRLEATLTNRRQVRLQHHTTQTLNAPPDYWETAKLTFENVSLDDDDSLDKFLTVYVMGKDCRFWQGNYGSKVAECSVRILWENTNGNETSNNTAALRDSTNGNGNNNNTAALRKQRNNLFLAVLILPIVSFLLHLWFS